MRLLMLPRYGRGGASSRYRFWQYIPSFRNAGYEVDVRPMLEDAYVARLYAGKGRSLGQLAHSYLRHVKTACSVRRYDAVLVEQELLPYFPAILETFAAKLNPRLILDYDDAAYFKYSRIPLMKQKIAHAMAAARAVVVGNHHLSQYARQFQQDVRLIPSVVDVTKYHPRENELSSDRIRICWIGTPITAAYLSDLVSTFRKVQQRFPNVVFRIIGTQNFKGSDQISAECLPWSEESEASLIAESDIGIMPLEDSEFERGKCGLKLIQYMAAGLPVVASPVGENRFIVEHGKNGFHARTDAEWLEHLCHLAKDAELRRRLGLYGRARAEREYSLQYGFEQWHRLLQDIAS